jgi:hypothetical protein
MEDEMSWESNTHRDDEKCSTGFYSENLKGRDPLDKVNENGKMVLKFILK